MGCGPNTEGRRPSQAMCRLSASFLPFLRPEPHTCDIPRLTNPSRAPTHRTQPPQSTRKELWSLLLVVETREQPGILFVQ